MRPAAVAVVLALLFGQPMHGQTPEEIQIAASTVEFIIKAVLEKTKENINYSRFARRIWLF